MVSISQSPMTAVCLTNPEIATNALTFCCANRKQFESKNSENMSGMDKKAEVPARTLE
jgi:hypothetical protein